MVPLFLVSEGAGANTPHAHPIVLKRNLILGLYIVPDHDTLQPIFDTYHDTVCVIF